MKKVYIFLALFSFVELVGAQSFVWAKQISGNSNEVNAAIATDVSGYIYSSGSFRDTVDIDPGIAVNNLVSTGGFDVYIDKLDSSGNLIWGKQLGGTIISDSIFSRSISLDQAGNAYLTGHFAGSIDFDPGAGSFTLTSAGSRDIFVCAINASGNFMWAKQMGGANFDLGRGITLDDSGNIYITGEFQGTADFDPDITVSTLTASGNSSDVYVSKLDMSGNLIWARALGGSSDDLGYSVAVDNDGNVYTTGGFLGVADFDPGLANYSLSSAGDIDIFLSKLNSSGNFVWAKRIGANAADYGYSLAIEDSGYIYFTGRFQFNVDFDPDAGSFNMISAGGSDVFVSKLDTSGSFIWAVQLGGTQEDMGLALDLDASGGVYLTGSFQGTADFYPGAGIFNLSSAGGADIFISKIDAAGNFVWAKQMGNVADEEVSAIAVDGYGYVYTTGSFSGTVDFDPGSSITNLVSQGRDDIFIVKLRADCRQSFSSITASACNSYSSPSGNILTTSGLYADVIPNFEGCDSLITINLTINSSPPAGISPLAITICSGANTTLTAFGGTTYTWSNSLGNDTTVSVSPSVTTTYFVTVTDANACSATAGRTVSVNQNPVAIISPSVVNICSGTSAPITASGGITFDWSNGLGSSATVVISPTVTTTYSVTVTDVNSCSATASKVATVNLPPTAIISPSVVTICNGDSAELTASGGDAYNWSHALNSQAGVTVFPNITTLYTVTVTDTNACSATADRTVTVNQNPVGIISPGVVNICSGDSATLTVSGGAAFAWSHSLGNNASVTVSPVATTTYAVTVTEANNCSSIASRTVHINLSVSSTQNNIACLGTSFFFNEQLLDLPGTYLDTLSTTFGCDSFVTLYLTFDTFASSSFNARICQGESYHFNGQMLTVSGAFIDTLISSTGCDSIVTLNLAVNSNPVASISPAALTICAGENTTLTASGGTSFIWSNALGTSDAVTVSPTANTTYAVTVTDANSCSATAGRTVIVNMLSSTQQSNTICFGTSFPFNGQNLTVAGTYYYTLPNINGCDSLIMLNLSLNSFAASSFSASVCRGSGYFYNGALHISSGAYSDTLVSSTGCDSIVTLNLTVNSTSTYLIRSICAGSSFSFDGMSLTASGTYSDTLLNSTGCDSIITLLLTVNNHVSTSVNAAICSGESYSFAGQLLTAQGIYRDTLTTVGGCDSAITLALTVNSLPAPTVTRTVDTLTTQSFSGYQWYRNGTIINGATGQSLTLTQTGNYSVVVTNANGCSGTSGVINVLSVDIQDIASGLAVKLYPNPSSGQFTLEFSDEVTRDINITDALGKLIVHATVTGIGKFNMENSAAGVYFLTVKDKGLSRTLRFSIEHN